MESVHEIVCAKLSLNALEICLECMWSTLNINFCVFIIKRYG